MRTKTVREWTYEEVRKALAAMYGDVGAIKVSQATGYLVEECPEGEKQPESAQQATKPVPF